MTKPPGTFFISHIHSHTCLPFTNSPRSGVQPDDDKSTGQSLTDKMGRSKDREVHGSSGESVLDKAKGALGMDKH